MVGKKLNSIIVFIDRYYLLAWRILFRIKKKITGDTRPSSYPYLSGDSFRAIADHIHDETEILNPSVVKRGDVVFVSNPLTHHFLQEVHPKIEQPYILIEHNGDHPIDKSIADLLDEKIIRFYAQDVIYENEKIIPIPIGLENLHYHVNGVTALFNRLRQKIEKNLPLRKNRIFFFFSVGTNPAERRPAKRLFLRNPSMDTVKGMLSPRLHLKTLMTYKFVASPPGNAIESCRTWEALYMKTVPIVKDFAAMRYFATLGLPIWVVDKWEEVGGYTEKDLSIKYEHFIENANWEPLHMDFWIKKIHKDQETVRRSL